MADVLTEGHLLRYERAGTMKWAAFTLTLLALVEACFAQTQARDVDLNVAVFSYLPDASAAIERLEEAFEQRYATIDLDIELWNPYDDEIEADGLSQLTDFDIIEIDACRIDQLMGGAFGGLDPLPPEVRRPPDHYIGPATSLLRTDAASVIVPHWVCGNFLVFWGDNEKVKHATTFAKLLEACDPAVQRPILAAMWGRTTLGELYADAVLDIHGPCRAREHLHALSRGKEDLDAKAKEAILQLAAELTPENRRKLKHFDAHAYFFPRQFAAMPTAVLLGYSERLYYTERERHLIPDAEPLKPDQLIVRQFAFSDVSQGTPTWVDGFVIPKGRLEKKRAAISAFLLYVQSPEAYAAFAEPSPGFAPSYLLPATAAAYDDPVLIAKQPLLPVYRDAIDGRFPVVDSVTWAGMRAAGSALREALAR